MKTNILERLEEYGFVKTVLKPHAGAFITYKKGDMGYTLCHASCREFRISEKEVTSHEFVNEVLYRAGEAPKGEFRSFASIKEEIWLKEKELKELHNLL